MSANQQMMGLSIEAEHTKHDNSAKPMDVLLKEHEALLYIVKWARNALTNGNRDDQLSAMQFMLPSINQAIDMCEKPTTLTFCWECIECGSQEYTLAVSETDVQDLGCSSCGSSEWAKREKKQ